MKSPTLLLILLTLCLLSCSTPETPEQVLRRLMEVKMKDGQFKEPATPGPLMRIPSTPEGDDHSLQGWHRMRNELLIITIADNVEANRETFTGIFKEANGGWESLFEAELIPGRLDTLLDFNHDGLDEFILDEYYGNAEGFDSHQFLYAKIDKPYWEKIDTLSRRSDLALADMSFEDRDNETVLTIHTQESDDYLGLTVNSHRYKYRWQPPNLIKEELKPDASQGDIAEFPDALTEDLAVSGFPRKWFPLAESNGKLKRQQLCGAESFIEIVSGEQHTWHEQGFSETWEASVTAFRTQSEGGYLVTLKLTDGSEKEIKFERNLDIDFVYTIDGKTYTPQPDKFDVSNSTEDCGN